MIKEYYLFDLGQHKREFLTLITIQFFIQYVLPRID